jgi:hypothetical protein
MATSGQFSCPPLGSFYWPLTIVGAVAHLPVASVRSYVGPDPGLSTLTGNHLQLAHGGQASAGFDLVAVPTPSQRRAFELLGAAIPLTLE